MLRHGEVVTLSSCSNGTYLTRNFATLGTAIVTGCRLPGLQSELAPSFNLQAPGRRQDLHVVLRLRRAPVFLVNSRHPLVCAPGSKLPLNLGLFSRTYGGIFLCRVPSTSSSSALVFSTSPPCRLRFGLRGAIWELISGPPNPTRVKQQSRSVTSHWPRILTWFPSTTHFCSPCVGAGLPCLW